MVDIDAQSVELTWREGRHEVCSFLFCRKITDGNVRAYPLAPGDHSPSKLRASLEASLVGLGNIKIRTFYLHAPDRSVPFEETVTELNKLHKEGKL